MRKIKTEITSKLKSKKGFTLTELLIATLLMAMMTVVLTAGITASTRVYDQAITYSEERVLLSTLSEAVMSEIRSGTDFRFKSAAEGDVCNFTFTSKNYGSNATFDVDGDGMLTIKGKPLISKGSYIKGKIKLLESGTSIIQPELEEGESSTEVIPVVKLTISKNSGQAGESREFSVKPMSAQEISQASA